MTRSPSEIRCIGTQYGLDYQLVHMIHRRSQARFGFGQHQRHTFMSLVCWTSTIWGTTPPSEDIEICTTDYNGVSSTSSLSLYASVTPAGSFFNPAVRRFPLFSSLRGYRHRVRWAFSDVHQTGVFDCVSGHDGLAGRVREFIEHVLAGAPTDVRIAC